MRLLPRRWEQGRVWTRCRDQLWWWLWPWRVMSPRLLSEWIQRSDWTDWRWLPSSQPQLERRGPACFPQTPNIYLEDPGWSRLTRSLSWHKKFFFNSLWKSIWITGLSFRLILILFNPRLTSCSDGRWNALLFSFIVLHFLSIVY